MSCEVYFIFLFLGCNFFSERFFPICAELSTLFVRKKYFLNWVKDIYENKLIWAGLKNEWIMEKLIMQKGRRVPGENK